MKQDKSTANTKPTKGKGRRSKKAVAEKKSSGRPRSRKSIIRNPSSSWVMFCNERRGHYPTVTFENVAKILSAEWHELSDADRVIYEQQAKADRERYQRDLDALDDDDRKALRKWRIKLRKKRKLQPKPPLCGYMIFVKEQRPSVVNAYPDVSFADIGRLMGAMWQKMNSEQRQPYCERAERDKIRYANDMEVYRRKKKETKETATRARAEAKAKKEVVRAEKAAAKVAADATATA